jgi:hypothetical protein
MKTMTAVFSSRGEAENAVHELRAAGVPEESITFLSPGTAPSDVAALEGGASEAAGGESNAAGGANEAVGGGKKMGAYVGGVVAGGAAFSAASAAATVLVPGLGPVLAIGFGAAALLGLAGAGAGAAVGGAIESNIAADELTKLPEAAGVRNALQLGRSVVVVHADSDAIARSARTVLQDRTEADTSTAA